MATDYNSTQLAATDKLRPAEYGGQVRIVGFDFTVPTGGVAENKTIGLCYVPKGATVVGGAIMHEDVGNNVSIGNEDETDRYLASTSIASASSAPVWFFATIAKKAGRRFSDRELIVAKALSGAWTQAKQIKGVIAYVID